MTADMLYHTETLPPNKPTRRKLGGEGRSLYRCKEPIRWHILILAIYTIVSYFAIGWAVSGAPLSGQRRVFRSGSLPVNQFYAGLALSALLAPAAILLRQVGNDIASLHPFALAAFRPVQVGDLDRIMSGGLFSVRTMAKYSTWFTLVQTMLMIAGASIVPVGTLILTVDTYAPQVRGHAVVGLPTKNGAPIPLRVAMGSPDGPPESLYEEQEIFLGLLADLAKGLAIRQTATSTNAPGVLGPVSTLNITFEKDVRYDGLVTYTWEPGCVAADDEIAFSLNNTAGAQSVEFTFPDGTRNSTYTAVGSLFLWSNASIWTASGIPINSDTYFAVAAPAEFTGPPLGNVDMDYSKPHSPDGLVLANGTWIQRTKCQATFAWDISSCVWDGDEMVQCIKTPGANTTELDTVGLDALGGYMNAVLWHLYNNRESILINPHQVFALRAQDMYTLVGLATVSITCLTTAGYWGTATVPSLGQPAGFVYVARMPVLVTVAVLLTLVVLFVVGDLVTIIYVRKLPIRKISFLTVATAVRGSWWDEELHGRCTLAKSRLRNQTASRVMFGVDADNPKHIGLAPIVMPIEDADVYYGTKFDD
jgi:hypothetical protein